MCSLQRKPSQITGIVDRKYMFLAEETKPDYTYCRPEVHVPCRGNQDRLQVLWNGSTCSLQRKPRQITGIVERKYMFLAEGTKPDYRYYRPEVVKEYVRSTGTLSRKYKEV
jgi:hypothetical protein